MSIQQQGFTLLELLLVISLIGIVGLAATTLIIDTGEIKRQDATEKRWDAIRKAVIGTPNLSLNGSPYLSGYTADMGRLPSNIQELFIRGTQPAWTGVDLYTANAAAGYSSALDSGWRGPYLYTGGSRFFRDGWSNTDADDRDDGDADPSDDDINFGWVVTPTGTVPDHTDLGVQSLGDNNKVGGTEFLEDYPTVDTFNMVNQNEWTLNGGQINFNINFSTAITVSTVPLAIGGLPHDLELRIYRFIDNGDATADLAGDIDATTADFTFNLADGDIATPLQVLTPVDLPIGRYAALIWCTNNTPANDADDAVYDGDCNGGIIDHNPYFFTLAPGVSQVAIRWNLP